MMRRRSCGYASGALLIVALAAHVSAGELPGTTDHAALATMYSREAKALREKVASHEVMLQRYEKAAVPAKGAPFPKAALVQHCRSLIAAYQQAATDAEQLAKMEQALAQASPSTE